MAWWSKALTAFPDNSTRSITPGPEDSMAFVGTRHESSVQTDPHAGKTHKHEITYDFCKNLFIGLEIMSYAITSCNQNENLFGVLFTYQYVAEPVLCQG